MLNDRPTDSLNQYFWTF